MRVSVILKKNFLMFWIRRYAEDLETIIKTVESVKTADFKMSFDPTLVRGMSYYTGPIFEISMDEFGGSVGGGGRYDEMIGKFTGNNTCACGFSIGFERIVMLLLERGYEIPTKNGKKAYLIEKNMPADKLLNILKQATEERSEWYTDQYLYYEEEQKVPERPAGSRWLYRVCRIFQQRLNIC